MVWNTLPGQNKKSHQKKKKKATCFVVPPLTLTTAHIGWDIVLLSLCNLTRLIFIQCCIHFPQVKILYWWRWSAWTLCKVVSVVQVWTIGWLIHVRTLCLMLPKTLTVFLFSFFFLHYYNSVLLTTDKNKGIIVWRARW